MRTLAETRVGAGAEGMWTEATREWRRRDFSALRTAAGALGLPVEMLEGLFAPDPAEWQSPGPECAPREIDEAPFTSHATAVVRDAFRTLPSDDLESAIVLALFLYGLCHQSWERTADHERISAVVEPLCEAVGTCAAASEPGPAAELLRLIGDEARCIIDAMGVEDTMNCSCPDAMAFHASAVSRSASSVLERESRLGPGLEGARGLLRTDAHAHRVAFAAMEAFSEGVSEIFYPEGGSEDDAADGRIGRGIMALQTTIAELQAVAGGEEPDRYESELRTHLATLRSLQRRATSGHIHIDSAEILYLYPFATVQLSGRAAVDRASSLSAAGWIVKGLHAQSCEPLGRTDMWNPTDERRGAAYNGVSIALPPIEVETTARSTARELGDARAMDDNPILVLRPEIRLSTFGNHQLRIRTSIGDSNPHELNQALRRGSGVMGSERFRSGDAGEWGRGTLCGYAREIIDDVVSALLEGPPGGYAGPVADYLQNDPAADFHVVVAVRELSVRDRSGVPVTPVAAATLAEEAVTGFADLHACFGSSLLFNPIPQLATSLEEWIRYPDPPPTLFNVMRRAGYAGEFATRTANTTVIYMPESPKWLIDEFRDGAEFIASLPALIKAWNLAIRRMAERISLGLDRLTSPRIPLTDLRSLRDDEVELRRLEAQIQRDLATLHSTDLVRTRPQREFLDDLWGASGLEQVEDDLKKRLQSTIAQHESLGAALARREDEQSRTYQFRVQWLLALITATSVAGALSWANDWWDISRQPEHVAIEVAVMVLAVAAAAAVLSWSRLESAWRAFRAFLARPRGAGGRS